MIFILETEVISLFLERKWEMGESQFPFFMKLTQNIVTGLLLSPHWSALRDQARVPGTNRPSVDTACN